MRQPNTRKVVQRPPDDLPPEQLQQAWEEYLRYQMSHDQMGDATSRPSYEVLVTPEQLELLASNLPEDYMKLPTSRRMAVFLEALRRVFPKLSLMQRLAVKKYFGIGRDARSQAQIAQELGLSSQRMASKYIQRGLARLKRLIRKELPKIVKASVQQTPK